MMRRSYHQKISESEEIAGLSVTVIYDQHKDRVEGAADFCQEKGWNYKDWEDMQGCEDECIIVMAVCPPKNSFTNLNFDIAKSSKISLSEGQRQTLSEKISEVVFSSNMESKFFTYAEYVEEDRYRNQYHGLSSIQLPIVRGSGALSRFIF